MPPCISNRLSLTSEGGHSAGRDCNAVSSLLLLYHKLTAFLIMLFKTFLPLAATLSFAVGPAQADGIYTKNSPVLQVDAKSYDALIAQSNHTSVSLIP